MGNANGRAAANYHDRHQGTRGSRNSLMGHILAMQPNNGDLSEYEQPEEGETAKMIAIGEDVTSNLKWIYEVLDTHNQLRQRHGAPPLRWSADCAAKAQLVADEAAAAGAILKTHTSDHGHGQNQFQATSAELAAENLGVAQVIQAWYRQFKSPGYNWQPENNGPQEGTNHFTQVVWHDTLEVGMACDTQGKGFVYAHYWPMGNIKGLYDRNVKPEGSDVEERRALALKEGVAGGSHLEAVVSFPGKYQDDWNEIVAMKEVSAMLDPKDVWFSSACVMVPNGDPIYGEHVPNDIDNDGNCFCYRMYGNVEEFGCKWFDVWRQRIKKVRDRRQKAMVLFKEWEVGDGDELNWDELPPTGHSGKGLGKSQIAEVAMLKRLGVPYVKKDVGQFSKVCRIYFWQKVRRLLAGDSGMTKLAKTILQCPAAHSGLRQIIMTNTGVGEDGAEALAQALAKMPRLMRMNLNGNAIGQAGITSIAKALPPMLPQMMELWLGGNNIGADGAKILANALCETPGLVELWLGGNNIKEAGCKAIADVLPRLPHLVKLGLSDNGIPEAGITRLSATVTELPYLMGLMLGGNDMGKEGAINLAAALPSLIRLRFLDVSGNNVDEEGMSAISENLPGDMHLLDFGDNKMKEEGALALASRISDLHFLQVLDVGDNAIGEAGILQLVKALPTSVQVLWLGGNCASEGGAAGLAKLLPDLTALRQLGLGSNNLGEAGVVALTQAFPQIPELQSLWLQSNHIGEGGAKTLAQHLPSLSGLQCLSLARNNITKGGAEALAGAFKKMPQLTRVTINGNRLGEEGRFTLQQARPDLFE